MSHEVESMAYTNEVPWHGLGTYVKTAPSVDEMLRIAGLNWTVTKTPLMAAAKQSGDKFSSFTLPVPRHFALVRSRDHKVLDVVGRSYVPIQNREAFAFFKDFVEAGDATMETAGSLRGGRHVWGLANLKDGFTVSGKDRVEGYLLVVAPHGTGSLIVRLTNVRVVCNNTLTLALREVNAPEFRMIHRRAEGFDEEMRTLARQTLGIAREQLRMFKENAIALKHMEMDYEDVVDFCLQVFQPKLDEDERNEVIAEYDKLATPTVKAVMDCYEHAPGADVGTGWGALNAVTYYADHVASGDNADGRLHSAWLGKLARRKEDALELLLNAVA